MSQGRRGRFFPRPYSDARVFRIDPPPLPVSTIVALNLLYAAACYGFHLILKCAAPDAGVWVLYCAPLGIGVVTCVAVTAAIYCCFGGKVRLVYDKTTRSVELPSYNVSFSREEGVQIEYVVASRVWGGERNVRNCALYLIACRDGKQERWSIVKPLFAGRSLDYLLIPLTRETDLPVVETKRYQDAWRNWQTQEPYPGTPSPDGS